MATFTITGRMSTKTVKKSLKEPSSSLSSPKILAISNINTTIPPKNRIQTYYPKQHYYSLIL